MCWLAAVSLFIYSHTIISTYKVTGPSTDWEFKMAFVLFLGATFVYLSRVFGRIEKLDVLVLLWRLFFIGMICVGVMLLAIIMYLLTRTATLISYLTPIYFFLSIFATVIFFMSAIFIFRRFVLYQRTQRKLRSWFIYQFFLICSLIFLVLDDTIKIRPNYTSFIFYTIFILVAVYLSTQVKWVAYLNFNQKLRALGLFSLILIICGTSIAVLVRYPSELNVSTTGYFRLDFLINSFMFPFIYSIFSMLVLFFNLPTSSIFEINSLEIASVNKINQAIKSNLDFTEIMNSLLDASLMAAGAKSGWVEMTNGKAGKQEIKFNKRITSKEITELKQGNDLAGKVIDENKFFLVRNTRKHRSFRNSTSKYRSMLAVPIASSNHQYGALFVASDLTDSFEDVTIRSINSFAEQAALALENAQLVRESIELERYQEQLKIAKEVQNQLLPRELPHNDQLEFIAISENAQEVGGDYFDISQYEPHIYKVAIGDVSGKGTTAAFYMAEVKGIFQALTILDLDVPTFICCANQALGKCMQKGFFVTLTYLHINTEKRTIEMMRAGHCPAIYYHAAEDRITLLKKGTLGLGILRDKSYKAYMGDTERLNYLPGDMVILFTDGIIEARNRQGEEFGLKRLEEIILKNCTQNSGELCAQIVQSAKEFTHDEIHDDYTLLAIKFKQ